ncbi:MAG: helix-turn-helix domain-containing protein [Clostridia bacterium]
MQEYLVKYRLHHSAYLLVSTPLSITEVMYSSGFNDLANFSKQFRRCFGCSPREYRKRASEGPVQINGSPKNQI